MKKIGLYIALLLCLLCLVSCDKNTNYEITLSIDTLPEGVEKITTTENTKIENDRIIYIGEKGGSFVVNVILKDGYDLGDIKIYANGHEATLRNQFEKSFYFEIYPNSNVNITCSGKGAIRSYNVTSTLETLTDGEELEVFSYSVTCVYQNESISFTADDLTELNSKINEKLSLVKAGSKITIKATHTQSIAFPANMLSLTQQAWETLRIKTEILNDKQIKTWEFNVNNDTEIFLYLSSTKKYEATKVELKGLSTLTGVFDSTFNPVENLDDLYSMQGDIYIGLCSKGANNVIEYLLENYHKLTINGQICEDKLIYRNEDNTWYIKASKPNAYASDKACGYEIEFVQDVINYMKENDDFTYGTNFNFKSKIMDWGEDAYSLYYDEYEGYRLKNGEINVFLCFAPSINDIKVIINGKVEVIFNDIQNTENIVKDNLYLYKGNNYYITSINNKNNTHCLVIYTSAFGEITSLEILSV